MRVLGEHYLSSTLAIFEQVFETKGLFSLMWLSQALEIIPLFRKMAKVELSRCGLFE